MFLGSEDNPRSAGAEIGSAPGAKKKLGKILISCLDVSNKIWLTVEMGRTAFHDGDAGWRPV